MQDSEHDIDNRFRNAAEHYSPDDGDSKWHELYPQLLSSQPAPVEVTAKKNNKKYLLVGLCLLVALFTGDFLVKKTGRPIQPVLLNAIQETEKNNQIAAEKIRMVKTNSTGVNIFTKSELLAVDIHATLQKNNQPAFTNVIAKDNDVNNNTTDFFTLKNKAPLNEMQAKNELINVEKKGDSLLQQQVNITENSKPDVTAKTLEREQLMAKEKDSIGKNLAVTQHHTLPKPSRLYVGIVAGPTYNQVKNQGFKKPGLIAGVIAGYQINNRAAIETGLSISKKYYYSDARYFTMDKIHSSMPVGMEVLSIEGSSSMLEIPLKFKYAVLKKNNTVVFSSAGISSYLMTNEKNNYLTLMNGAKQNITGSYNTPSKYLAASFNASIGYENKIGKTTNIRIEPYVNIPLRGVGVGSMQVMSAGVQVGIIKLIR